MIRVTVELDALGLGVRKSVLATLHIINDGTGSHDRGNYTVRTYGKNGRLIREGRVENWARNAHHPVDLLAAALDSVRKK